MYETFDAFEYIEYLRRRWRVVAVSCGVALTLSLSIGFLQPKRYTATASVVIEPPGGNDVRISTAVSAVYLESLKTFETFAESDTLFAQAAARFHLQSASNPQAIERLKHRVLKVSKPRDTKVLEIQVTLPDAKLAQAAAQYLAEQTIQMSRHESLASDEGFSEEARKQLAESRAHLDELEAAWAKLVATGATIGLQSAIDSDVELRSQVRQQLLEAQANVAEYQQQASSGSQFAREQLQAEQARAALLGKRSSDLNGEIEQKSATLAARTAKQDALQTELKVAQSVYQTVANRVREMQATAGSHSEQLRVLDPGIVPQSPSSPNIQLYAISAVLVALVADFVALSLAFVYRRRSVGFRPPMSREMRA